MNRIIYRLLLVASLVSVTAAALAVGRVTVDPNTVARVERAASPPLWETDKRLDAKIEYDAGNARLHKVIEDLAKMSKVTIYSGASPSDWRARDIPVTVALRGVPLRKVLLWLTYSTQSVLKAGKTENGEIRYRIVRDPRAVKAMDDFDKAAQDFEKNMAAWSLQTATQLKDIPASEIKPPGYAAASADWLDGWYKGAAFEIEASRFLAALDKETMTAVLAGNAIRFSPRNAPAGLREASLAFIRAAETKFIRFTDEGAFSGIEDPRRPSLQPVPAAELEDGRIRISLHDGVVAVEAGVQLSSSEGETTERTSSTSAADMADLAWGAANYRGKLPKRPELPEMPRLGSVCPDLKELSAKDCESAQLSQKVAIQPNADGKPVPAADAIIAVSKATGLSVVCADFTSHRDRGQPTGRQTESWLLISNTITCSWKWDADAKAMVGEDMVWFRNHKRLLPESIVNNVIAKANGDGVDLDDLAQLSDYTREGVLEWLGWQKFPNLQYWSFVDQTTQPLWALYNSLSPTNKAQAKSGDGLSLARLDKTPILQFIKYRMGEDDSRLFGAMEESSASRGSANADPAGVASSVGPPRAPEWRGLLNPDVIPSLVLRIDRETSETVRPVMLPATKATENSKETGAEENVRIPPGFSTPAQYAMVIKGTDGKTPYSLKINTGGLWPYFTPERRKSLEAAARRRNEAATPAE